MAEKNPPHPPVPRPVFKIQRGNAGTRLHPAPSAPKPRAQPLDGRDQEDSDERSSARHSKSTPHSPSRADSDSRRGSEPPSPPYLPNKPSLKPSSLPQQQQRPLNPTLPNTFTQPRTAVKPPWASQTELKLDLWELPKQWGTMDVYKHLNKYGILAHIHVSERTAKYTHGFAVFRPPPVDYKWLAQGCVSYNISDDRNHFFRCRIAQSSPLRTQEHPEDPGIKFLEVITIPLQRFEVGVMSTEDHMQVLHQTKSTWQEPVTLSTNIHEKAKLQIAFHIGNGIEQRAYRFDIHFQELKKMIAQDDGGQYPSLMITLDTPPIVFRKPKDIISTHAADGKSWSERSLWYRQVKVEKRDEFEVTELCKPNSVLNIPRWLAYRLVIDSAAVNKQVDQLFRVIEAFSGKMNKTASINVSSGQREKLWDVLSEIGSTTGSVLSSMSALEQMQVPSIELDFMLHYQLEVCLSQGVLHECNITRDFMQRLASMDSARAIKILEKAADNGKRIYDPMDVFKLQGRLKMHAGKIPGYCALMPAANVTPTTVYFNTPVLETSNRVIRMFSRVKNGSRIADRFLRVKFTDERYLGRVRSHQRNPAVTRELFLHIKRTMKNGIRVGNRRYEFLAFSNSQFREHGAYFYASTPNMTAQDIRDWMGDFQHIPVVAKYASRLGQCLSTTRALSLKATVTKIDDIKRNDFCFTDGVGMMSPFLAQMVAQEHGLPSNTEDYPSAIQFRLAGCKGILVVNPAMRGMEVAIRPSQEKFAAPYYGLEVCRISQFSASFLNVQIILVLSTLGVTDNIFHVKLKKALAELEEAMSNEKKAVSQLCRNVDQNQMTLALAHMIGDGFMRTKEPFFMSCLHLWRSWQVQYIKQKAKILIEDGAFVLGCVDETATLRGHFNGKIQDSSHLGGLPQIFLQVPADRFPRATKSNDYRVIQGPCILARNPSLHPGDIRVVMAVKVPALRHIKNCVVLPQTGDRDVANMCSGGDLDGDDYLVMWDPDMLPKEWNHEPMDYEAPTPDKHEGEITTNDITDFAVKYFQEDVLSLIATNHRYWADIEGDGVKNEKCLRLARLHSVAVDYAKTGVAAHMPSDLWTRKRPHWSQPPKHKSYHSAKILGQLYDAVQLVAFKPKWETDFDSRILCAYELSNELLEAARDVKAEYDEQVRRIMAQFEVKTEFEVSTTFVTSHDPSMNEYKFSERFGEVTASLKQHIKEICYIKAGTTAKHREWDKLGPFIAAMYVVTADEVAAAFAQPSDATLIEISNSPPAEHRFTAMPFISFPWIFYHELGHIANNRIPASTWSSSSTGKRSVKKRTNLDILSDNLELEPIEIINNRTESPIKGGEMLDLYHQHSELPEAAERKRRFAAESTIMATSQPKEVPNEAAQINNAKRGSFQFETKWNSEALQPDRVMPYRLEAGKALEAQLTTSAGSTPKAMTKEVAVAPAKESEREEDGEEDEDDENIEWEQEEEAEKPSLFDKLDKIMAA